MSDEQILPWEREGYGYSGPLDPLHDTKINRQLVEEWAENPVELPALGSMAVVFSREEGDISYVSLADDAPDISPEDLQLIRQQYPHLR